MFSGVPICLGEAILNKLKENDPKKVLEINIDNDDQLSVEEARIQTISIAGNLLAIQVQKGDIVVIYSKPNTKITPIVFACWKIGAAVHFLQFKLQESSKYERVRLLNPKLIIYELEYKQELFDALKKRWPKNLKHVLCQDSKILHHTLADEKTFQLPNIGDPKELSATLKITTDSNGSLRIIKGTHMMLGRDLYSYSHLSSQSKIFCSNHLRATNRALALMLPVFYGVQLIYSADIDVEETSEKIRNIIDSFKVSCYFDIPVSFLEIIQAEKGPKNSTSLTSLRIVYIFDELVTEELEESFRKIVPNCKVIRVISRNTFLDSRN